jgi:hypothetical protein
MPFSGMKFPDDRRSFTLNSVRNPESSPGNRKAPQKQCKDKTPHESHHYERPDGLINWCQGRGNAV